MRTITNFYEVHEALKQFIPDASSSGPYTLDVMTKLMDFLGNPQNQLKVIHVAGTSGKTSTAYYIASLLTDIGYVTGLSISPHINEINERSQINVSAIAESEYCRELATFLDLVDKSNLKPSHFEVLVAFAYWLFNKRHVDYAVIEVGLGGLLDGTNVVDRPDKICVITDIGLDHIEVLGDTLAKIASQKAGIIHENNTVFMNIQSDEVMEVIRDSVAVHKANLYELQPYDDERLSVLPAFQQRNFQLARSIVEHIDGPINHDVLSKALQTHIPGRMEILSRSGKTLVMDGAHNEQKIGALVDSVKQQFPDKKMTVLVSFGTNKIPSVIASLKLLRQLGSSIIITEFHGSQDELRTAIPVDELEAYARQAGFVDIVSDADPTVALELLYKDPGPVGMITGSLYLLHDIRDVIFSETKKSY